MPDSPKVTYGPFKQMLTGLALTATAGTAAPPHGYSTAETQREIPPKPPKKASAGDPMTVSQELLEAKLEAVEARIELKVGDRFTSIIEQLRVLTTGLDRVEGLFAPLEAKVDGKPGAWKIAGVVGGAIATGLTVECLQPQRFPLRQVKLPSARPR